MAKRLAFFRANVNSADEGIGELRPVLTCDTFCYFWFSFVVDDFCIANGSAAKQAEALGLAADQPSSSGSSDTGGEDLVSDEEESKLDSVKINCQVAKET